MVGNMLIPECEVIPVLRMALERGQRVHMIVKGRSMLPFIRAGDVVEITSMPPLPVLGSVVLAQLPDGRYPLHRIIARVGDRWMLRGDNCGSPDGMVRREDLLGVVTRVQRNGCMVPFVLGWSGQWIGWLSLRGWLLPITRVQKR